MPIRNPFARRAGASSSSGVQDENRLRPESAAAADGAHPGFERVDTVGSKASSALSIRSRQSQDTGEYKMSVVNDSGVYLPPSPTEKEATWPRRYLSRTSTETRSSSGMAEIEHFSISRESFDSYRRSFDICAKRPVIVADPAPRQSLDSAYFSRLSRSPRSAVQERRFEREPPTPEEGFEDVGLNDDETADHEHGHDVVKDTSKPPAPRRRGFFKFGSEHPQDGGGGGANAQSGGTNGAVPPTAQQQQSTGMTSMARFLPGRKRGISGQGSELGAMPRDAERPGTATTTTASSSAAQETKHPS